jgi:glycosyltransferase involved in cell wall biosynthesis
VSFADLLDTDQSTDRRPQLRMQAQATAARLAEPIPFPIVRRPRIDPGPRRRIMHVIFSTGFAGSERAAAETCNALAADHDVAIVIRADHRGAGGASIRDYIDVGVEVIQLPAHWYTRRRLAETIRAWRPDLVHTHLRRGTRYVAQIQPGVPHVCTLHIALNGPHYLQADTIFCISDWQLQTIPDTYRGRVLMLPNSLVPEPRLDRRSIRNVRSSLGATDDDFVVGGVGRLAHSKGFDVLVKAFKAAGLPSSKLVIVGEGRERARLERLANGRALFTGFRNDAKRLMQAMDLFVCASRVEPFGRVIMEALDAGTPVIASDAAGPRDIARHLPVEVVPADDVDALASALKRAAARPRERVPADLSEFRLGAVTCRLVAAYDDLIAERVAFPC